MNYDNIIMDFPVTVYGNLEKYNDVISKGRCRIFYKGANRNGTFITDEFADRLLSTIPYAPVKGIFNAEEDDFTDHGIARDEGRIYGIVPAEPNLAWESQIDEDGVERTYACVDVLLYTGIYKEASMILGKAQSMELYGKNIKGDWQIIDGKRYYVFSDACFLGLQALGDDVEPCFEGAAFYTVYNALEKFMDAVEEYQKNYTQSGQGGNTMPSVTFKVSDSQKLEFLWNILNPGFNEENGFALDYAICDVYDEYAIAFNYNERIYERVYYVKDDETDSLSVKKKERCYIIDVNENEKNALEALHKLNGDTYEKVDESFAEIANLKNEISENSLKVEELNNNIATLTMERDNANVQLNVSNDSLKTANENYTVAQATIEALTSERDALVAYKKTVEDDAKRAVIATYAEYLSVDILDAYATKLDDYSIEDLDRELTYAQKKAHPEMFSKQPQVAYVPKEDPTKSGLDMILSKYEKKH